MRLKKIMIITSMLIFSSLHAMPPYKVLQSCREQKAYNEYVTYKALGRSHFTHSNDPKCDDLIYNIGISEDEHFQYRFCEKDYLVIHGKDVDISKALNLSVTGVVYPHYLIPHASSWSKITFEDKAYLCISGPLSQSGYGAANLQYYIVEHAFDPEAPPALYFYFFNKNIHSWIASHEKRPN
jgi:hypothetical protein